MSALTIDRFSSSNSGRSVSTIIMDGSSESIRPRGATPDASSSTCRKPSWRINEFRDLKRSSVCAVISNKAGVERAGNFLGITHVGDLTAIRDAALRAKKGGELGGRTDAGVMNSHDLPKFTTV